MTTITTALPEPAGAVSIDAWEDTAEPYRYFTGSSWVVDVDRSEHGSVTVVIDGVQEADGRTERHVCVHVLTGYEDLLTPQEARELARALIDAADEATKMDRDDQLKTIATRGLVDEAVHRFGTEELCGQLGVTVEELHELTNSEDSHINREVLMP